MTKKHDPEAEFARESKELKNLLDSMTTEQRDSIIDVTSRLRKTNRELALELGPLLREARPQLVRERRWKMVVYQIARISGVAYNTILNWTDGDYGIQKERMRTLNANAEVEKLFKKLRADKMTDDQILRICRQVAREAEPVAEDDIPLEINIEDTDSEVAAKILHYAHLTVSE
jgi:hypothetical protein